MNYNRAPRTSFAEYSSSFYGSCTAQARTRRRSGKSTIPCYCGCGESAGYQSNLNCFINKIESYQSIVWDDHGTRCGICLETAAYSAKLKKDGKSVKEIRQIIDNTYMGLAKPTDTPY